MVPTTKAPTTKRSDIRKTVAIKELQRRNTDNRALYITEALASPPELYHLHFLGNPPVPKEQLRQYLDPSLYPSLFPPLTLKQTEAMVSLAEEMRGSAKQRRARPKRRTRRTAVKRRGRRPLNRDPLEPAEPGAEHVGREGHEEGDEEEGPRERHPGLKVLVAEAREYDHAGREAGEKAADVRPLGHVRGRGAAGDEEDQQDDGEEAPEDRAGLDPEVLGEVDDEGRQDGEVPAGPADGGGGAVRERGREQGAARGPDEPHDEQAPPAEPALDGAGQQQPQRQVGQEVVNGLVQHEVGPEAPRLGVEDGRPHGAPLVEERGVHDVVDAEARGAGDPAQEAQRVGDVRVRQAGGVDALPGGQPGGVRAHQVKV